MRVLVKKQHRAPENYNIRTSNQDLYPEHCLPNEIFKFRTLTGLKRANMPALLKVGTPGLKNPEEAARRPKRPIVARSTRDFSSTKQNSTVLLEMDKNCNAMCCWNIKLRKTDLIVMYVILGLASCSSNRLQFPHVCPRFVGEQDSSKYF